MDIFTLKLKDGGKPIPKGTTILLPGNGSWYADDMLRYALRKKGFYDVDIDQVMYSAAWEEVKKVSDNDAAMALQNELRRHTSPRIKSNVDPLSETPQKKEKKAKKNKSKKKKSCLTRLILAPFLLIWWIIKKAYQFFVS